jgi:mono/diheme cytochrome c family protein
MLKPILFLSSLTLSATMAALTSGIMPQQPTAATNNSTLPNPESRSRAKKIYTRDCAMCHGDNGNGQTEMAKMLTLSLKDWTDPKALAGKQDEELFQFIRKGRGKMLPEDEDRTKDEDVRGIILYIRSFSTSQAAAPLSPTN